MTLDHKSITLLFTFFCSLLPPSHSSFPESFKSLSLSSWVCTPEELYAQTLCLDKGSGTKKWPHNQKPEIEKEENRLIFKTSWNTRDKRDNNFSQLGASYLLWGWLFNLQAFLRAGKLSLSRLTWHWFNLENSAAQPLLSHATSFSKSMLLFSNSCKCFF